MRMVYLSSSYVKHHTDQEVLHKQYAEPVCIKLLKDQEQVIGKVVEYLYQSLSRRVQLKVLFQTKFRYLDFHIMTAQQMLGSSN